MEIKIDVTLRSPELAYAVIELAEAIKGTDSKAALAKVESIINNPVPVTKAVELVPTQTFQTVPVASSVNSAASVAASVSTIPMTPISVQPQLAPVAQIMQLHQQQPIQTIQPLQQALPVAPPVQPQPLQQGPITLPVLQANRQQYQPIPPLPVAAPSYTVDQLAVAGMSLVEVGRRDAVLNLLNQFGVTKLTDIPKER
jgi:hypothetical protein